MRYDPLSTESRRCLPNGYRVSFAKRRTGHWYGGPIRHEKARCYTCKKPLRLVWDIDLFDSKLPDLFRQAFSKDLTRLSLYYCFDCPEATTYILNCDELIEPLDSAGENGGDGTPYTEENEVPEELPKRPLSLKRIPSVIEGILAIESELTFASLDAEARRALSRYLGEKVASPWDISLSQLGGLLVLVQGHWDIKCPNRKCATRREFRKLDLKMQELAVVEKDAACGFKWAYAPLAFHVCRICGTIQGNFRCD